MYLDKARPRFIALVVTLGALCLWSPDSGAAFKPSQEGEAKFVARGPAGWKIVGTTKELSVKDDGKTLVVAVSLEHLTTGLGLRDRHMRDKYLEVARFPTAAIDVARSAVTIPKDKAVSGDATGVWKMHGKSKTIPFHYQAKRAGDRVEVSANAQLDFRDFGIAVPKFMGMTVKPNVTVNVTFSLRGQ